MNAPDSSTGASLRDKLNAWWALDLRSLAAWRVCAGILLLIDLAWRAFDLETFYTDKGLVPRQVLASLHITHSPSLSLHALSGELTFEVLCFGGAAACAIGMVLGWRTRLMVFLSWVLLTSLHARNPVILNRGDMVLRLMLFWSLWLPLGARWSLDARRVGAHGVREKAGGLAAFAMTSQLGIVYLVSVLHKCGPSWWDEGLAVYYALKLDDFVTPLGRWVGQHSQWSAPLTWGTLIIEVAAPALLWLAPAWRAKPRGLAVCLGCALHLGLLLTMRLDLFMWVMWAAWLPFWPSSWWDRLLGRSQASVAKARRYPVRRSSALVVMAALCGVIVWSVGETREQRAPKALEPWLRPVGLTQRWSMFAPDPARDDGWLVAAATDAAASQPRDLWRGERPVSDQKPARMDTHNLRWRSYMMAVQRDAAQTLAPALASWLCERASFTPEVITLIFEVEYSMPPGSPDDRWSEALWSRRCP